MERYCIQRSQLKEFRMYLQEAERTTSTIEKYERDVTLFFRFMGNKKKFSKEDVVAFKDNLKTIYQITSINSMLTAVNTFLSFLGYEECKVKLLKQQRRLFLDQSKELTVQEYQRLLYTAKSQKNLRLYMMMQTICATGIRISELKFITVETLQTGRASIDTKGKLREILYPRQLQKKLMKYCREHAIKSGSIFITKNGKALNRSNIWREMKDLCKTARVDSKKVFPHNLRHLFACTYYKLEKDIVRLADLLGHSNIETTRIYTMTSSTEYRNQLSRMGLVT